MKCLLRYRGADDLPNGENEPQALWLNADFQIHVAAVLVAGEGPEVKDQKAGCYVQRPVRQEHHKSGAGRPTASLMEVTLETAIDFRTS